MSAPAFWGPEPFNLKAWSRLVPCLTGEAETATLLDHVRDKRIRTVLDVGGASGRILRKVDQPDWAVTVVDPAADESDQLASVRHVVRADIETSSIDDAYDLVIATWLLQYVRRPTAVIDMLVARTRVAAFIVQGSPDNELIQIYNLCAKRLGIGLADHWALLDSCGQAYRRRGFHVVTRPVDARLRWTRSPRALASTLVALHFFERTEAERRELQDIVHEQILQIAAVRGQPCELSDAATALLVEVPT